MTEREALKLALEAFDDRSSLMKWQEARDAVKEVLAQPEQEPVATMPSNTRYTVAVEGRGLTYWDNIHDAITNAQRAVYSGPENTTRALDDLKGGRIAEWSYGFSAVRIYPPQNTTPPQHTWVGLTDDEIDQGLLRSDYAFKTAEAWRAGVVFAMTKLKEKNT